ncbi:MAG: hypothetical protein AAB408_03775 [Patescibacteria group bacterium]
MKIIASVAVISLTILAMVFLHLVKVSLAPFPWSAINILFVPLILLMSIREARITVWLAFFSHFFIELYATTPFGVVLASSTLSVLLTFWLSQSFFIHRSWYTAFALSAVAIFLYRLFYSVILQALSLTGKISPLPISPLLPYYGWEILLTSVVTGSLSIFLVWPKNRIEKL